MAFKGYQKRSAEHVEKRATQQGGDFKGFIKDEYKTWTPKKGENWVRILPPTWPGATHYGKEVFAHYGVGPEKASVICNLKQHGKRCVLCDARAKAEHNNATDEELREYKWSKRVAFWMIDQKDKDKGAQVWVSPWTIDRDLAKISKDRRSGEVYFIDDPDNGYDFFFDKEGEGIGTKYAGFQLARSPSEVPTSVLDYIADHPLPDTFMQRDHVEVMALYTGGMDEASSRSQDDRGRERDDDRRATRERNQDEPTPEQYARDGERARRERDTPREDGGRDREEPRQERGRRDDPPFDGPYESDREQRSPRYRDSDERSRNEDRGRDREEPRQERSRRDERDDAPAQETSTRRRMAPADDARRDMDRTLQGDDLPDRATGRGDDRGRDDDRRERDRDDDRGRDRDRRNDPPETTEGGGSRAATLRARMAADRERR